MHIFCLISHYLVKRENNILYAVYVFIFYHNQVAVFKFPELMIFTIVFGL